MPYRFYQLFGPKRGHSIRCAIVVNIQPSCDIFGCEGYEPLLYSAEKQCSTSSKVLSYALCLFL